MRLVRQPILFYDKPNNVVRRYGGWPYGPVDFDSEVWSFEAGSTVVNWVNNTSGDIDPATNGLSLDSQGPFASANAFSDSTFFNLGGNIIDPDSLPNMTVLSGLVTQDFSSTTWSNQSTDLADQSGFRTQARAVHAPNFGDGGFLVVVGGEAPPTEASVYETGSAMVDMSVITLYDIATATWFTQEATGDVPPPRSEFCAVGAASSDGRYFELFVYGGSTNSTLDLNHADDEGYLNVYALSFPAFRWFKSPDSTPVRRACHTCSVIGNRQMVSVGGRLPSSLQTLGQEKDPWASGIGVFDMTEFAWADHYDAAAEAYESPDVVKEYYASSYQEPSWDPSSQALASIFAYTANKSSTDAGNATSPGNSSISSSNGNGTHTASDSSSGTSHTGAVAGGVVGGVVGVAAIVGLLYWMAHRRHSRKALDEKGYDLEPVTPVEAPASSTIHEAESKSRSELDGLAPRPTTVFELPVDDNGAELRSGR
ncbi:hypothetical protein A1O1_02246 [Capronia coronata CBS 617.96]|uniref:Kelch repeat protein n=1 Tax=Capronia coronata CBS 617.96 TaxID=1182541 RepID=W9YMV5_9EURO|nr:uncharacterized protein A1O1_02246 [Capronia coronata CBS 617.96]EXJ93853.1 hypothetical protein A1O1_02246 [Capronia coronata CBS 617.96]